jgi:hypothetical protein
VLVLLLLLVLSEVPPLPARFDYEHDYEQEHECGSALLDYSALDIFGSADTLR